MENSGRMLQGFGGLGLAALFIMMVSCSGDKATDSGNQTGGNKSGGSTAAQGGQTAFSGGTTSAHGGAPSAGGKTTESGGVIAVKGGTTTATGGSTTVTGGSTTASGGTTTATGGTTTAAGGTITASGGVIATDGGVASRACSPGISPADPTMTDFSSLSWNQTSGRWGTPGNLTGSLFRYKDPKDLLGSMSTIVLLETMVLTGTINPGTTGGGYAGGGLTFSQCVNTTAYSGIQFTLGGSTGGCNLLFQIQTYSQQPVTGGGGCSTGCYGFPKKRINVLDPQPITVTFAELAGTGKPATGAEIAAGMLGLQWQFEIPTGVGDGGIQSPCVTSLTIDNLKFVP